MFSAFKQWKAVGLLALVAKQSLATELHDHNHHCNESYDPITTLSLTVISTETIYHDVTHTLPPRNITITLPAVTVTCYTTVTDTTTTTTTSNAITIITTIPTYTTEMTTTTTETTDTTTILTSTTTRTTTTTTSTTSETTTATTTTTGTTTTTTLTTSENACPTECSVTAGTVNVVYWPTSDDYTYPSTFVDTRFDYTFTSPSVYMVINTIYAYGNSSGPTLPSATNAIFALDLVEVSTIVLDATGVTRQLTLNDLGTNCPQTVDPAATATKSPEPHCDPILAAPNKVKLWASPCGACGKLGLFDPPYAVPPVTGSFIITTAPETQTPTTTTDQISTPPSTVSIPSTTGTSAPTTVQTASATRGPICIALPILISVASIILNY